MLRGLLNSYAQAAINTLVPLSLAEMEHVVRPPEQDNDLALNDMTCDFEANYVTQSQLTVPLLAKPLSELFKRPTNDKQIYNRCKILHTIRHALNQDADS